MLALNTIHEGDCLELMKDIPDGSVDMVLCDLPYGVTRNKWDIIIPFEPLWAAYKRVCKPNAAIVLTAQQPFTTKLISSNYDLFRYDLIWEKSIATGFLNANKIPLRGHECVCIFYKKLPVYNPQKHFLSTPSFKKGNASRGSKNYGKFLHEIDIGSKDGSRFPRSIFSIKYENSFFDSSCNSVQKTLHPTQKPVALFEYLIRTYTHPDMLVLDNCIGSGTTAVAAINSGRQFLGIEKDPTYCEMARKRVELALSQPKLFY